VSSKPQSSKKKKKRKREGKKERREKKRFNVTDGQKLSGLPITQGVWGCCTAEWPPEDDKGKHFWPRTGLLPEKVLYPSFGRGVCACVRRPCWKGVTTVPAGPEDGCFLPFNLSTPSPYCIGRDKKAQSAAEPPQKQTAKTRCDRTQLLLLALPFSCGDHHGGGRKEGQRKNLR
jgi:hypothetical protein